MTDPHGGGSAEGPRPPHSPDPGPFRPTADRPPPPAGRSRPWVPLAVILTLVVLIVVALVGYLTLGSDPEVSTRADEATSATGGAAPTTRSSPPPTTSPRTTPPATTQPTTPAPSPAAPPTELQGVWVGTGSLTTCQGFGDTCPSTLPISVSVDCPRSPCTVVPFDSGFSPAVLSPSGGGYSAMGSVPLDLAPTCNGVPTLGTRWLLSFTVQNGSLVGSYSERTLPGLDCGGTQAAWDFTLSRA